MQGAQAAPTLWTHYKGNVVLPQGVEDKSRPTHQNSMCPAKTVQVKKDTRAFGRIKNVQKREVIFSHIFYDQTIVEIVLLVSLQVMQL